MHALGGQLGVRSPMSARRAIERAADPVKILRETRHGPRARRDRRSALCGVSDYVEFSFGTKSSPTETSNGEENALGIIRVRNSRHRDHRNRGIVITETAAS